MSSPRSFNIPIGFLPGERRLSFPDRKVEVFVLQLFRQAGIDRKVSSPKLPDSSVEKRVTHPA